MCMYIPVPLRTAGSSVACVALSNIPIGESNLPRLPFSPTLCWTVPLSFLPSHQPSPSWVRRNCSVAPRM